MNAKLKLIAFGSFLVLTGWANSSMSSTIITNLPPSNEVIGSYIYSAAETDARKAVGFTMNSGSDFDLTSVTLRLGVYGSSPNALVQIFSDSADLPGSLLVTLTNPSFTLGGALQSYVFTPASSFTFTGGTSYWLVASNFGINSAWYRSDPNLSPTGPNAVELGYKTYPTTGWVNSSAKNSYQVDGTLATVVPVPASIWLFSSALAGFGLFRKSRRLPNQA